MIKNPSAALIGCITGIALTQIASAADLPRKAPAYTPPPPRPGVGPGFTSVFMGVGLGQAVIAILIPSHRRRRGTDRRKDLMFPRVAACSACTWAIIGNLRRPGSSASKAIGLGPTTARPSPLIRAPAPAWLSCRLVLQS